MNAEPAHFDPTTDQIPPDGVHVLDGSCVVDVGELTLVNDPPSRIKPIFKDEMGIENPKTDAEDLQNFANWD